MRILAFARVAAFAAGALAGAGGAAAQEGMFMKDLLGTMGIIPKERPPIEYRARAPLVLPPKMELREPADSRAVQAAHPQWPNDPDVLAARRREADARTPVTQTERRRLEQNPTLSIHEIRQGRRPGAEIPTAPVVRRGDNAPRLPGRASRREKQGRCGPLLVGGAGPRKPDRAAERLPQADAAHEADLRGRAPGRRSRSEGLLARAGGAPLSSASRLVRPRAGLI
jgi:hypothetical protein